MVRTVRQNLHVLAAGLAALGLFVGYAGAVNVMDPSEAVATVTEAPGNTAEVAGVTISPLTTPPSASPTSSSTSTSSSEESGDLDTIVDDLVDDAADDAEAAAADAPGAFMKATQKLDSGMSQAAAKDGATKASKAPSAAKGSSVPGVGAIGLMSGLGAVLVLMRRHVKPPE